MESNRRYISALMRACLQLSLLLCWMVSMPVAQADTLPLYILKGGIIPAENIEVLRDPDGKLTIEQVISPRYSNHFSPPDRGLIAINGEPEAIWIHIKVRSKEDSHQTPFWVLSVENPIIEQTRLYKVHNNQAELLPRLKPLESPDSGQFLRNASYRIDPTSSRADYYLKLSYFGPTVAPIHIRSLGEFASNTVVDYALYGLICGAILSISLYNLFLFFSTRRRIFIYYVAYMLSCLTYSLFISGYIPMLLDVSPKLSQLLEWVSLVILMYCSIKFTASFFGLTRANRTIHILFNIYKSALILVLLFAALSLNAYAAILVYVLGLSGLVSYFIIAFDRLNKGLESAKYFILALSFMAGTGTVYMLWHLGMIDLYIKSEIIFSFGPVGESILFAIGIGHRIKVLEATNQQLKVSEEHFKKASRIDGLTGLYNKGYMQEILLREMQFSSRYEQGLCFVIMDIDNFKTHNDTYGHLSGDEVLRCLALSISHNIRSTDYGCRFGGEEFSIILPGSTLDQSKVIAERVRTGFSQFVAEHPELGGMEDVTVSLGVYQVQPDDNLEIIVSRADEALYKAKRSGKNRVVLYEQIYTH
ncbi:sensor domain-containing diguanylate cyclase [Vibrio sp. JC009]|uniref:sensor domain-containing diguanylate cyclase n=1 Tax=Vibrio sp. JC009 TaxID=2912314 RepID=UPI0023AFD455|nr:diguanylate cyclase [Vibrio sp. JC009]WED24908.1 sensor domain-containing diguanylate cyclase [Vibrio sp. JC009]